MAALDDNHPLWPEEATEKGQGAGAVIPLTSEDLSFGLLCQQNHRLERALIFENFLVTPL